MGDSDSVVGLAVSFQFPSGGPTPPSRTRRLDDQRPGEGQLKGLNTDQIAQKVFSAAKFSANECVVDGQSYVGVSDERVRGSLIRLFGPRLSLQMLEENMNSLEKARWGWIEGTDSTVISLEKDIAVQRVSDLCILALSSLSPTIVTTVSAILGSLAESLQTERTSLERHMSEVTVYIRSRDSTLILVNSRLDVNQRTSKLLLCLCGRSSNSMYLSLEIRRIAISTQFEAMIRSDSPRIRIRDGVQLLPPSPSLDHRSLTAPTCTPPRHKPSSRARQGRAELEMAGVGSGPSPSPLSVVRELRSNGAVSVLGGSGSDVHWADADSE